MDAFFEYMVTPEAQSSLRRAGIGPPPATEKQGA
jgi:hypothetical protein